MIFPWLSGFMHYRKAPLTWGLIVLNFLFFIFLPGPVGFRNSNLDSRVNSPEFLKVQAYHYFNFLKDNKRPELDEMFQALKLNEDASSDFVWVAQVSFRDADFLEQMKTQTPYPDEVLQKQWDTTWNEFYSKQGDFRSISIFGISSFGAKWTSYITYQFIHSGWMHLISNMLVLLLFGAIIETMYGSIVFALLYISGGVAGALYYALVTGISFAPLVGASGCVSALMGFYLITEFRKSIPFYYFMAPVPGYFGVIYLSKWWIIPTAILNDLASLMATPEWLMGVAHTAHLGAVAFGLLIGLAFNQSYRGNRAHFIRQQQLLTKNFQLEQNHVA